MTTAKIGGHVINVEVVPTTTERDSSVPGLAKQLDPLDESQWPMTVSAIEEAANLALVRAGGDPSARADCVWALGKVSALMNYEFVVREATTAQQRAQDLHRSRREYLRGEIS